MALSLSSSSGGSVGQLGVQSNPEDQHTLSLAELCKRYACNTNRGLSASERMKRLNRNGSNTMAKKYTKEQLAELEHWEKALPSATLVRIDGDVVGVPNATLVIGDLCVVQEGDLVGADMRVLDCADMTVNMNRLIGERDPKPRSTQKTDDDQLMTQNMLLSGSFVLTGYALALVVAVGDETIMGRTLGGAMTEQQRPLLKSYSKDVQKAVDSLRSKTSVWPKAIDALPELSTITHCIFPVHGVMSFLSKMHVRTVCAGGFERYSVAANGKLQAPLSDASLPPLVRAMVSVSACRWDDVDTRTLIVSNHYETALFNFLVDLPEKFSSANAFSVNAIRRRVPLLHRSSYQKMIGLQFSVHRDLGTGDDKDARTVAYFEGQPEAVMARCTHMLGKTSAKATRIDDEMRREFADTLNRLAALGDTVVAFAEIACKEQSEEHWQRRYESGTTLERAELPTGKATFLGMATLTHPCKPDLLKTIKRYQTRGQRLIFVSPDLPVALEAVLKECGINTTPYSIDVLGKQRSLSISGPQLADYLPNGNPQFKKELWEAFDVLVVGRCAPQQKQWILDYLQNSLKASCLAIAKWSNDDKLLASARVGCVLRGLGPHFMKENADLIVGDNRLSSLAQAIEIASDSKTQKVIKKAREQDPQCRQQ